MSAESHRYSAGSIEVTWDETRCLHFAECVRGLPEVFDPAARPWVRPSEGDPQRVADVIRRCPTGALHYRSESEADEAGSVPTEVRPTGWGPLLLRGRLWIKSVDGGTASETRMAACACARTSRPPYCDGACREPRD